MAEPTAARLAAWSRARAYAEAACTFVPIGAGFVASAAAMLALQSPLIMLVAMVPSGLGAAVVAGGARRALDLIETAGRGRILSRTARDARRLTRIADAAPGELVAIRGIVRVRRPAHDPATGEPVAAYVRWARRTPACDCWSQCSHRRAEQSLWVEGRIGDVVVVDDSGTAVVGPTWLDTASVRSVDGSIILRDGDPIALTGRAQECERRDGETSSDYRGARRTIALEPDVGGRLLLLTPISSGDRDRSGPRA